MDKDIKETAEEVFGEEVETKAEITMNEAPASTTIRAYYKGFSVLFTKRNMKGKLSVDGVQEFVDDLVSRGFNPSWKEETKGQPEATTATETRSCVYEGCQGTQTLKSGISKKGKNWRGWFCDLGKEHVSWV